VLKPGGTLILTVLSVYPVHGYPADNWRFMPDGLRHLLRAFAEVEVLGELDFAESLASVNCHYGHVFTGRMGRLRSGDQSIVEFRYECLRENIEPALASIYSQQLYQLQHEPVGRSPEIEASG
jgi:hypothetical protein